ncbi:anaerobic ribonucleoside-triphosphate reductase activating protein [Aliarcobacter cibarius]|uniref:anaerobic ribonucleoside-triphosphate reductase activating protein n=1 Tax=Aliarcobacter cibarius TaxID=255507 RepID=UPI002B1BCFEE|nr:anaerobic ribonucleoside-triphosphate reductase activating protein [Aliarcobacter cibarius]
MIPGEISCVVWHISCNLKCKYCYNDNIVFSEHGEYSYLDILDFLKYRKDLLTAVVLSGGEATMHDLRPFCRELKKMKFKVKLDTNGLNLKRIKELIDEKLIDFISLDFKATRDKFKIVTSKNSYDTFLNTLKYLINIKFPFELRTTVNRDLLDEKDINNIIEVVFYIGYNNIFYIQKFLQTESNIGNITQTKFINEDLIRKDLLKIEFRN